MSELLTCREVAKILRIAERTVWRRVEEGVLPVIRIGHTARFSREDLEQIIARSRIPPAVELTAGAAS